MAGPRRPAGRARPRNNRSAPDCGACVHGRLMPPRYIVSQVTRSVCFARQVAYPSHSSGGEGMNGVVLALLSVAGLALPVVTLDGQARTFPKDAGAPRSIFVVTFAKSASKQAEEWTRSLQEAKGRVQAEVFQVAVLEDVPRLFRSMARSGITRSVPAALHGHFWIAETASKQWKECAGMEAAGDAHVFVLDQRERVVWRAHGSYTEAKVQELLALPPPAAEAPGSGEPKTPVKGTGWR